MTQLDERGCVFILCVRSRSLLKSRRISGRLYEIRVHPIQSLHSGSSQSSGRTPNVFCSSTDTTLFNDLWHLGGGGGIQKTAGSICTKSVKVTKTFSVKDITINPVIKCYPS